MTHFVLIHSPLLRNLTWKPVAEHLREQGHDALTPLLIDSPNTNQPYWKQEVDSLDLASKNPILIGHSGAGALLPLLYQKLNAQAIIFVDAVLLFEPLTRLDLMKREDKPFGQAFEAHLQSGGKFPDWTDEQLETLIPDADLRQQLLADLQPRKLDFFTETIPVPPAWEKDVPIGYIQLSNTYAPYADQARAKYWHVLHHPSHHFLMLAQPDTMTDLILAMSAKLLPNQFS